MSRFRDLVYFEGQVGTDHICATTALAVEGRDIKIRCDLYQDGYHHRLLQVAL